MKTKETDRLDCRLTPEQKVLIEQAATVNSLSMSAFAKDAMLTKAREVMNSAAVTELTSRDRGIFQAMLADDVEPNEALRDAASRYRHGG